MIGNRGLLSLVAALVLPIAAMAGENINYTFVDIQYVDNGIDETYTETSGSETVSIGVDGGGGFALLGSLAVHDNIHMFANYARTDVDLDLRATMDNLDESLSIGGDVDDWRIGVGFNVALSPDWDGIAQVAWEDRTVDFGSVTVLDETMSLDMDDSGVSAIVGLRGNITKQFELNGQVHYSQVLGLDLMADAEDDILDNDVIFAAGGIYHMNDMFSLGASVEAGDSTAWHLFARVGLGS